MADQQASNTAPTDVPLAAAGEATADEAEQQGGDSATVEIEAILHRNGATTLGVQFHDPTAVMEPKGTIDSRAACVSVDEIIPGSPASVAGICIGDELIAVQGEDVRGATFRRVCSSLLRLSYCDVVTLRFRRDPVKAAEYMRMTALAAAKLAAQEEAATAAAAAATARAAARAAKLRQQKGGKEGRDGLAGNGGHSTLQRRASGNLGTVEEDGLADGLEDDDDEEEEEEEEVEDGGLGGISTDPARREEHKAALRARTSELAALARRSQALLRDASAARDESLEHATALRTRLARYFDEGDVGEVCAQQCLLGMKCVVGEVLDVDVDVDAVAFWLLLCA